MPASPNTPETWLREPPTTLVVGDGPYAQALATTVGAAVIGPQEILAGPAPTEDEGHPQVLRRLGRAIIVAGINHSAADLVVLHDALWRWIEKLSPEGDQHELAILFVLPPTGDALVQPLAAGLGLSHFERGVPGHGLALMDDNLSDLLAKAAAIVPQDLPPLRARRAADERYAALDALRKAVSDEALVAGARRVLEAFRGQQYLIDIFCRPPSHRHGNQLRRWLNGIVTGQVTHHDSGRPDECPANWLDGSRFL